MQAFDRFVCDDNGEKSDHDARKGKQATTIQQVKAYINFLFFFNPRPILCPVVLGKLRYAERWFERLVLNIVNIK